jgi:hypothetical protein
MAEIKVPYQLEAVIADLKGKLCCCQRVGEHRSLRLGFGKKLNRSRMAVRDPFFGEWQIGTYTAAWRIIHDDKILLGSMNPVNSCAELDEELAKIQFGPVLDIDASSRFCVRVSLEGGMFIDFMAASNDESEVFFVLQADGHDIEYRSTIGWSMD